MKCPICDKAVQLHDPEMPFCSERCRLIDLGNWASEKYVIPVPLESEQDLEGGSPLPSNEEDAA